MLPPRPAVRSAALCGAAVALALAATLAARRHPCALDDTWDHQRLARELAPLGYRSAEIPEHGRALGGFYLAREDDTRSWEEIAARPRVEAERRWRGLVVVKPAIRCGDPSPFRDTMQAGPFLFFGDPHELDRIASHLGVAR
jgi:hypothetical protein